MFFLLLFTLQIMLVTASACVMQYNTINKEPIPTRELFFLCVCLSGLVFIIFIYWLKIFQLDRLCCSQTSLWNVLVSFTANALVTLTIIIMQFIYNLFLISQLMISFFRRINGILCSYEIYEDALTFLT